MSIQNSERAFLIMTVSGWTKKKFVILYKIANSNGFSLPFNACSSLMRLFSQLKKIGKLENWDHEQSECNFHFKVRDFLWKKKIIFIHITIYISDLLNPDLHWGEDPMYQCQHMSNPWTKYMLESSKMVKFRWFWRKRVHGIEKFFLQTIQTRFYCRIAGFVNPFIQMIFFFLNYESLKLSIKHLKYKVQLLANKSRYFAFCFCFCFLNIDPTNYLPNPLCFC